MINEIADILENRTTIFSRDLVAELNKTRTVPLTQKRLSLELNKKGIYSKKLRIDGKQGKGYRLHQFRTVKPDGTVPCKRYAYRYKLKNNAGAGTWVTTVPPAKAEAELMDRFLEQGIKTLELIN